MAPVLKAADSKRKRAPPKKKSEKVLDQVKSDLEMVSEEIKMVKKLKTTKKINELREVLDPAQRRKLLKEIALDASENAQTIKAVSKMISQIKAPKVEKESLKNVEQAVKILHKLEQLVLKKMGGNVLAENSQKIMEGVSKMGDASVRLVNKVLDGADATKSVVLGLSDQATKLTETLSVLAKRIQKLQENRAGIATGVNGLSNLFSQMNKAKNSKDVRDANAKTIADLIRKVREFGTQEEVDQVIKTLNGQSDKNEPIYDGLVENLATNPDKRAAITYQAIIRNLETRKSTFDMVSIPGLVEKSVEPFVKELSGILKQVDATQISIDNQELGDSAMELSQILADVVIPRELSGEIRTGVRKVIELLTGEELGDIQSVLEDVYEKPMIEDEKRDSESAEIVLLQNLEKVKKFKEEEEEELDEAAKLLKADISTSDGADKFIADMKFIDVTKYPSNVADSLHAKLVKAYDVPKGNGKVKKAPYNKGKAIKHVLAEMGVPEQDLKVVLTGTGRFKKSANVNKFEKMDEKSQRIISALHKYERQYPDRKITMALLHKNKVLEGIL